MKFIDLKGKFHFGMVLLAILFLTAGTSYSATFTNATPIVIGSDAGEATPYPSAVVVSGLTGTITSVKVTFNGFSHTWMDDLGIVLVGPTGAAIGVQSGAGTAGAPGTPISNLTYSIADSGATVLPNNGGWATGTYKPSVYYTPLDEFPAPGPGTTYNNPGPAGGGTATMASTFNGTNPNGTWNLFIMDFVDEDSGQMAGGWTIEITTGAPGNVQHTVDFDGDGKTDYSITRNSGVGTPLFWHTSLNGGGTQYTQFGLAGDIPIPADYDGDNKTDVAIWRGSDASYYILNSNGGTVRAEYFGISTDDPTVVGDYDGDGKDDMAVYRAGAISGAASTWYYRTTAGGPVFAAQWGQNGDFPAPGDYDGDGKADFVVQRNGGGGAARFHKFLTTAGSSTEVFGTPTDVILPGDYDGDGKTDLAVTRGVSGSILWWFRPSGGGADVSAFFGASATDYKVQGDYDGDGKTDRAVWRPGAAGTFYVDRSNGSGLLTFQWGQSNDFPSAGFNAH